MTHISPDCADDNHGFCTAEDCYCGCHIAAHCQACEDPIWDGEFAFWGTTLMVDDVTPQGPAVCEECALNDA